MLKESKKLADGKASNGKKNCMKKRVKIQPIISQYKLPYSGLKFDLAHLFYVHFSSSMTLLMHMIEPNRHCPVNIFRNGEIQKPRGKEEGSLIILNQPITSLAILRHTWECTSYRVCADGGANRLHDALEQMDTSLKNQYVGHVEIIRSKVTELRDPSSYRTLSLETWIH